MRKGTYHTQEAKLKQRIAHLGKHPINSGFKKGMIPWNKGTKGLTISWNKNKHPTQETRLKQSLAHKGMHISPQTEFKKGMIPWSKGLTKKEAPQLRGGAPKGKPSWNKGMTVADDRIRRSIDAAHKANKGKSSWNKGLTSSDPRIKRSTDAAHKANRGKPSWNRGKHESEATKEKQRQIKKEAWKDPIYARRLSIAIGRKPNQDELYIDAILQLNFPAEWKYVGDGKFWIEGRNPDFVNVNGKKIVIEYNGFYRHTQEKDEAKTQHYAKYGFKTVNLYPKDLNDLETILKNQFTLR